jgi:hypothetical protein
MEMSVDDLVPMPELKLKIEEWLKKHRGNWEVWLFNRYQGVGL